MPPYLPPEILVLVGQHCLYVFTDQELWFSLSQVSRLFRHLVVRDVTTERVDRPAFDVDEQDILDYTKNQPMRLYCRTERYGSNGGLEYTGLDSDRPWLASFQYTDPPYIADDAPCLARRISEVIKQVGGPGLGGLWQAPLPNTGELNIRFEAVTLGLQAPRKHDWAGRSTRRVDIGVPIDFKLVNTDNKQVLIVWFDWRKIWTLKLAPMRQGEIRKKSLIGKPQVPPTAVKGQALAELLARGERFRRQRGG